jgi:hypothetical protein
MQAFGLRLHFLDEALGFAELDAGGSVFAIASQSLGETLMPGDIRVPLLGNSLESRSLSSQAT